MGDGTDNFKTQNVYRKIPLSTGFILLNTVKSIKMTTGNCTVESLKSNRSVDT